MKNRQRAQGTVGPGARNPVHGANAANPEKLRSWAADEAKIHFLRETIKYLKIVAAEPSHPPSPSKITKTLKRNPNPGKNFKNHLNSAKIVFALEPQKWTLAFKYDVS